MWTSIVYNGPSFITFKIPSGIHLIYNNKPINLSHIALCAAILFSHIPPIEKDSIFLSNFWNSWKPFLPSSISSLRLCDFSLLNVPLSSSSSVHNPCIIDGVSVSISNNSIEPMSIFRGRGLHPLRGTFKPPISHKDVSLNSSSCVHKHLWASVSFRNDVKWLATYKDSLGTQKYIYPSFESHVSDKAKFELARSLRRKLSSIRSLIQSFLSDSRPKFQQLGAALWLIDKMALRVGNEKSDLSSDTVGTCTLRVEHISLLSKSRIKLHFLGKDSISFNKTFTSDPLVYRIISSSLSHKKNNSLIFDLIDSSSLNYYLNKQLPGLTAKTFRTCHASRKFSSLLSSIPSSVSPIKHYRNCNKAVAILCNHKHFNKSSNSFTSSLSTSKANYLDPRITFAYCNKHSLPPSTFFSDSLLSKFSWAQDAPASFKF